MIQQMEEKAATTHSSYTKKTSTKDGKDKSQPGLNKHQASSASIMSPTFIFSSIPAQREEIYTHINIYIYIYIVITCIHIYVKLLWSVGLHDAFYFPKYDDATYGLSATRMLDFSK